VNSLICADYFTALKGNASPTADESQVISDLKKAIANLTIFHAIEKLTVRITEKGITMFNAHTDNPDGTKQQASDNLMQMTMRASKRDGDNYLTKAKKYLDNNASAIIFPTYFSSSYYSAPIDPANVTDVNENLKFYSFIR